MVSTLRQPATSSLSSGSFDKQAVTKRRKSSDQSPDGAKRGASFWPMWYSALITFMLNNGGFRSAVCIDQHILRTTSPPIWTRQELATVSDNFQQSSIYMYWRLSKRGNIIRTALCWIVWHNVHSQQHTYMSSSYRSNRLGLSLGLGPLQHA